MTVLSASKECPFCGDNHKTKPFITYENGYHCFSCGASKNSDREFLQIERDWRSEELRLPRLESSAANFSLESLEWLYKYSIFENLIYKHCICESEGPSLVFPVFKDGRLVTAQQRFMSERKILTYGKKECAVCDKHNSDTIVIVEDFISYVRIAENHNCICLFGTKLPFSMLSYLTRYNRVVLWLDGDKPGQTAALLIKETLTKSFNYHNRHKAFAQLNSKYIKNILTNQDPKVYTYDIIKRKINEA